MLTKAIQKAKGDEEKKVGVSLKMAETFRNKLQTIADKNNVSLNALIIGMLETVYESKESNNSNYMDEYTKFSEIIQECNEYIEKGLDEDILGFNPFIKRNIAINEIKRISKLIQSEEEN